MGPRNQEPPQHPIVVGEEGPIYILPPLLGTTEDSTLRICLAQGKELKLHFKDLLPSFISKGHHGITSLFSES